MYSNCINVCINSYYNENVSVDLKCIFKSFKSNPQFRLNFSKQEATKLTFPFPRTPLAWRWPDGMHCTVT